MGPIERFGHFEIAQGANAQPVELARSPDEFVCLAFDTRVRRLVELHVLKSGARLKASEKSSAVERARLATRVSRGSFMRVIECGEDGDAVYYSSSLNDGEPLERYLARRGALPSPTAFSLVLQLLDDVLALQNVPRLLCGLKLTNLLITLQEETFLQMRALDYGFSHPEPEAPGVEVGQRLVHEACLGIFLLLTGRAYAGDDCDRITVLTGLPSGMRAVLRNSLASAANAPSSLQRLRDEVRDALMAQTRDLQGRASRRHLVAVDAMLPKSALHDILLHDVSIEQLLKGRLVGGDPETQQRYPFTFHGVDARTEAPLTVHLLPPRRIVSNEHYDAVPLQMWRFSAEKHPNILRSLSVWESPDLTFLTEQRCPGFPLSRLIAERVYLNPAEVLILLRQVKAGIDQALECGVEKLDIHPCNVFLKLAGAPHAREMEKLLQKRLDAWPKFTVMLRPHMTMRSLYEPLLVEEEGASTGDSFSDAKDFRGRSYVALAGYLLSGERQVAGVQRLPDSVPEALAGYVVDCIARSRHPGRTPSPQEFLAEFEKRAAVPEGDAAEGGLTLPARRGASRERVAEGPMESAGSVSDFDEDQPGDEAPWSPGVGAASGKGSLLETPTIRSGPRHRYVKGRLGVWLWLAVFVLVAFIAYALLSGGGAEGERGTSASDALAPASPGGEQKPRINPATGRPFPPEIRRALVPSEKEKEELRRQQGKPASGGGAAPPAARGVLHPAVGPHAMRMAASSPHAGGPQSGIT